MRQRSLIHGEIAGIPTVTFMMPACAKMSSNVFDGKEKARLVPVTLPRLKFLHGDHKEACVSLKPESDTQADLSVMDDTQKKPRRRHHRRYRAYWK